MAICLRPRPKFGLFHVLCLESGTIKGTTLGEVSDANTAKRYSIRIHVPSIALGSSNILTSATQGLYLHHLWALTPRYQRIQPLSQVEQCWGRGRIRDQCLAAQHTIQYGGRPLHSLVIKLISVWSTRPLCFDPSRISRGEFGSFSGFNDPFSWPLIRSVASDHLRQASWSMAQAPKVIHTLSQAKISSA